MTVVLYLGKQSIQNFLFRFFELQTCSPPDISVTNFTELSNIFRTFYLLHIFQTVKIYSYKITKIIRNFMQN